MSLLRIFNETSENISSDFINHDDIQSELAKINIEFQRWDQLSMLTEETNLSDEQILNLYSKEIETIKHLYNFHSVDTINVTPEFSKTDKFEPMRKKFLDEHIHTDHEVRYFIDGQGLFYIHKENKVYGILCTAGDFITVPENTPHWFDMGSSPNFKCIRFFTDDSGWTPNYLEKPISSKFPLLDDFLKVPVS